MSDLETNLSKSLSRVLDMERQEVIEEANNKGIAIIDGKKTDLEKDYEATRKRINDMLDLTDDALESAINIATSSESPRAIEALSTLIKSISELNSSLLDTHIKIKKLRDEESSEDTSKNTTNNTFVFNGTTSDLKKFIDEMKNKKP